MIDNFFRMHEKNRQLNWDDYFGKARYDHPHAFGSAAQVLTESLSVREAVDETLQQALYQLPACASIDLAIVAIHSSDTSEIDAVLTHLAQALPGHTRVLGWAGQSLGEAVRPAFEGLGARLVGEDGLPFISVTLASIPSVAGRGFYIGEEELRLWKAQGAAEASGQEVPVGGQNQGGTDEENVGEVSSAAAANSFLGPDKKWEQRVGVTVNEAYKDPPVILLLGSLEDASLAQAALQGLDRTYPGTARIGGLSDGVVLFSREGGPGSPQGARIFQEEGNGLLGLALLGDIRALTFVNQRVKRVPNTSTYRVESVSEDGKTIMEVSTPGGVRQTPVEAGLQAVLEGEEARALGLGDVDEEADMSAAEGPGGARQGADRWSLVSVRGSQEPAAMLPAGWVFGSDGSLRLAGRVARKGQFLSIYAEDTGSTHEGEMDLVGALRREVDDEWGKAELGVTKFRPAGVLLAKDAAYPSQGIGQDFGEALGDTLAGTPIAGLVMDTAQFAPLVMTRSSALYHESLVVHVLACKAKRRDLREIRFRDRGLPGAGASNTKPSPLDMPFDPQRPVMDEATGEVAVNRQAALIGTDVRVDNMAWNVREESVYPRSLFESMVWTKERELYFVREDAPLMNLMRTVMMMIKNPDAAVQAKARGLDVTEALKAQTAEGDKWAVLGDISRGTPFHGVLAPLYDPEQAARATIAGGQAGAVAVRVDQTYYGGKYQHVREVKDALREARVPVVADDLVLYPYQLYLAKLFGADGVKMGQLSILSDEDLQYQVKICQTLSLTPIISVASLSQLRRAAALPLNQTSVLTIDDRNWATMGSNSGSKHRAVEWLQDPVVQASLQARREGAGAGGAPLILVEGRSNLSDAEKEELKRLGVGGEVFAFADLPSSVRVEAGRKKNGMGSQNGGPSGLGMGGTSMGGGKSIESLKELLRAQAAASSSTPP